jgi:small subunit ribosomal protein S15
MATKTTKTAKAPKAAKPKVEKKVTAPTEAVVKEPKKVKVVAPVEVQHEDKHIIIESFAQHEGDTGSPEVQIALLTSKIKNLADHLEINKKDIHSRRGLLKSIAKRRRMLNYLKGLDEKRYAALIKRLELKK